MSEKEKKYHHASHSKYLLLAHLVFAVKYRKKVLREKVAEDMKAIALGIAELRVSTWDNRNLEVVLRIVSEVLLYPNMSIQGGHVAMGVVVERG
jgi:hypothetical protein